MHIRKEKEPLETVNYIKSILNTHGIAVIEKDIIGYADNWYSIRLELADISGIGTNGKGVSIDAARASAYAELMERLQSGFLLGRLFKKCNPRIADDTFSFEEIFAKLANIKIDIREFSSESRKLIQEHEYLREKSTYYHVNSKNITELPNWFIETNCGSNGLCAGNSPHEAILQGINEIQERFVRKKLFLGELSTPNIDHSYMERLESYSMVKAIEEKGYKCIIKDLTCNGKYPVLAVVIMDHSFNYYLVSLGADYNMDICLQRCITEAFQGRNFSLLFKQKMTSTFQADSFFISSESLESDINYQMNILNNSGAYPFTLFGADMSDGTFLNAFVSTECSNSNLLRLAIDQLLVAGENIYIKDYSYLGFPTYRVFIPGMTELCELSVKMIEHINAFEIIDSLYYQLPQLSDEKIQLLCSAIYDVMKLPFYQDNLSMNLLTGIPLEFSNNELDLNNVWLFLTLCAWKLKQYKMADYCYNEFLNKNKITYNLSEIYQVMFIILKYLAQGKTEQEARSACAQFDINHFSSVLFNPDNILVNYPNCPNCKSCKYTVKCNYKKWLLIKNHLNLCKKQTRSDINDSKHFL